ncbi:hypothetical protein Tco_0152016 [Tanacetum coccineum]
MPGHPLKRAEWCAFPKLQVLNLIHALGLEDPLVLRALEECKGVSEITLLIHGNVAGAQVASPLALEYRKQSMEILISVIMCFIKIEPPMNLSSGMDLKQDVKQTLQMKLTLIWRALLTEALHTRMYTTHWFISTTISSCWYHKVSSGVVDHVYRYEIYAPGGIWVAETLGYYLVDLELNNAWLSIDFMNPKAMLKSLTLSIASSFEVTQFEKLKTVQLKSINIRSLLDKFPLIDKGFPCLSSLNIKADVWSGFEVYNNPLGRKTCRVTIGLESFSTYLLLVDPELTFSVVLRALEECKGVIQITLLIHGNVAGNVYKPFISRCKTHCPGLKWRWGI